MRLKLVLAAGAMLTGSLVARADSYSWASWSSATAGSATPGSASGTIASSLYGSIAVNYSGQNSGLTSLPSWTPASTFSGGSVGNAPPKGPSIQMEGGQGYSETITFSKAVVNPTLALWSLGASYAPAYFDFNSSEPFTIASGGPSSEYGGQSIMNIGNGVVGVEGNGVVEFLGTYTSLTFTTPSFEYYYAFTVGEDATLTDHPAAVTPEPSSFALLGTGLLGVAGAVRRRFRTV